MSGLEIVNTYNIEDVKPIFIIWLCVSFLIFILAIIFSYCIMDDSTTKKKLFKHPFIISVISLSVCFMSLIISLSFIVLSDKKYQTTDIYEYEMIITGDVDLKTFNDKYTIINQDSNILYVINRSDKKKYTELTSMCIVKFYLNDNTLEPMAKEMCDDSSNCK